MAWENIPWMIGGTVAHAAELARLATYAGGSGREGILRPADLAVVPLATPGAGVRVSIGACVVINRSAGADAEAYVARNDAFDTVTLAATTTVARSDLILARIEDPYQSGNPWAVPAAGAKQTTLYVRSVVISGVTGSPRTLAQAALDFSAIPLARVDIPANTTAVQAAHIVDLRQMVAPITEPLTLVALRPTASDPVTTTMASWPDVVSRSLWIPPWATHANVSCTILDALSTGTVIGTLGVVVGTEVAPTTGFDIEAARRCNIATSARVYIPPALRGTMQTVRTQAQETSGAGDMTVDTRSQVLFNVSWLEAPV